MSLGEVEVIQYDLNIKDMLLGNGRLKKQPGILSHKAFFDLDI